ncbi:fungal-specific transcription factor domain-containing protein [Dichotomopilus funicola]|uniref:Fungal-specific transcription factor domain-containing protein n=1 Tax=Dichotomopilus funicola TaxID=1934379 RepID=A0AAN6ZR99_9PEZI|nr:fungal-specific transcription factor domain-containing protein [Dichotomopilus funicola]
MTGPVPDRTSTPRATRPPSRPPRSGRAGSSTRKASNPPKSSGSANSPDNMSDEESADLSLEEFVVKSESGMSPAQESIRPGSEDASGALDDGDDVPNMPQQKRRRVTRACDECQCTYDKPSNRRRNPAPQYIEALENKLDRAMALLREFMPNVDLADPNLDPAVQQEFRNREKARARTQEAKAEASNARPDEQQDAQIMSMIESIGQLDLKESGEWDFHGVSSGAVFLRRMKDHFQTLLGNEYQIPFLPRPAIPPGLFTIHTPSSPAASPLTNPTMHTLPPRDRVDKLCHYSLDCATCLLRVVHRPTFFETLDRLYSTPQGSWGNEEQRFLGLLYSVLALGSVYNVSQDEGPEGTVTYSSAVSEGVKYYNSARLVLQDMAECRDMASLQALVYMILFLQATSNISDCYAFLGIALRSCLRMGLHRHLAHDKITPIEDETRRRVFHVIRQMDFYVSAILGFPLLLHDEDVDQPLPTEVDDEYITKEAIRAPPPGTPSFFQAFNAHNELMRILARVVKEIYPLRGIEEDNLTGRQPERTFTINYSRVKAIEQELHDWQSNLNDYWRPSHGGPIEATRVRTLLRFGFAHVQMMLYRPFLHYISPRLTGGKKIEPRYYDCAAAGITVSRNIIHIGIEIQKQAVLIGPYWFILYTEFFAILSLIFFVLENPDKAGSAEILADARAGKDVIAALAKRSLAADRITAALNVSPSPLANVAVKGPVDQPPLFEKLPDRVTKSTARPTPTKKRSAPAPASSAGQGSRAGSVTLPSRSDLQDTIPQRRSEEMVRPAIGLLRREARAPPQRTASFDTIGFQHSSLAEQSFTNFQEILPMNMPLHGTGSDSNANTQGTMPGHAQGFHQQGQTGGGSVSSLYKMDAMMFPSEDPFAYPSQPPIDPAGQHPSNQTPQATNTGQSHDAMQFYIPNVYHGIEGQLLEPMSPYLMSQAQRSHQQQHGLNPATQMYGNPNMLAMQSDHGLHGHPQAQHHHQQMGQHQQQQHQSHQHQHQQQHQQIPQHPHPHQQQQQQHQHHQQQQQQGGDMMGDMMPDPIIPGEWDDVLNSNTYR